MMNNNNTDTYIYFIHTHPNDGYTAHINIRDKADSTAILFNFPLANRLVGRRWGIHENRVSRTAITHRANGQNVEHWPTANISHLNSPWQLCQLKKSISSTSIWNKKKITSLLTKKNNNNNTESYINKNVLSVQAYRIFDFTFSTYVLLIHFHFITMLIVIQSIVCILS